MLKYRGMLLWLLLGCMSCSGQLGPAEYAKLMGDRHSGPWVHTQDEHFVYALQYRPIDYQALTHYRNLTSEKLDSLRKEHEGEEYYYLTLRSTDPSFEFPQRGTEMRRLLEHDNQRNINLKVGGKVYGCQTYFYEPSLNVKPESGFLLSFNLDNEIRTDGLGRVISFKNPFTQKTIDLVMPGTIIDELPVLKM